MYPTQIFVWGVAMNKEQSKVNKFFRKFTNGTINNTLSWFGAGGCIFVLIVASVLPIQLLLEDLHGNASLLLLMVICGPLAGSLRIMPYESYGTSPNNRKVSDILKYHPIQQTKVKKLKFLVLVRFMAKVAVVCMFMQIPVTLYEYGGLSWINFIYIVVTAFLYPVGVNGITILFEK